MGRSESAVRRLKKAASDLGEDTIPEGKEGSGRNTRARMDKMLEREVRKDLSFTAKEMMGMRGDVLQDVSVRIIQHRLQKDLKLPCRRAAHKSLLTDKMKKQRLGFCRKYKHWTSEDWYRVQFSDESAFNTIPEGERMVRRSLWSIRQKIHGKNSQVSRRCDGVGLF